MPEDGRFEPGSSSSSSEVDSMRDDLDVDAERDEEREEYDRGDNISMTVEKYYLDLYSSSYHKGGPFSVALTESVQQQCSACRTFSRGRFPVYNLDMTVETEAIFYHHSLTSLRASVNAGCLVCASISHSLNAFCNETQPPIALDDSTSVKCKIHRFFDGSVCFKFYLSHNEGRLEIDGRYFKTISLYSPFHLRLGPEFHSMWTTEGERLDH